MDFFDHARFSVARALQADEDRKVAAAFMQILDEEMEKIRGVFTEVASLPPETSAMFLEVFPKAIFAFTREAAEAMIKEVEEDREPREALLALLKRVQTKLH